MTNSTETNEHFIKSLQDIGEAVQKWPEWKREGWAILDLKEDSSTISCSSLYKDGERSSSSSNGKESNNHAFQ